MSKTKNEPDHDENAMIQFGGEWLPAEDVRKKMDTTTLVVDAIDRFNSEFPHLATTSTREVVPLVRQRLQAIRLRMHYPGQQQDLAEYAVDLLAILSPEDVIEALAERHGEHLDMLQLIQLAGDQPYLLALSREAGELEQNMVSPEQTSQLWNDLARPAPGGGLWNADKVVALRSRSG